MSVGVSGIHEFADLVIRGFCSLAAVAHLKDRIELTGKGVSLIAPETLAVAPMRGI